MRASHAARQLCPRAQASQRTCQRGVHLHESQYAGQRMRLLADLLSHSHASPGEAAKLSGVMTVISLLYAVWPSARIHDGGCKVDYIFDVRMQCSIASQTRFSLVAFQYTSKLCYHDWLKARLLHATWTCCHGVLNCPSALTLAHDRSLSHALHRYTIQPMISPG